MILTVAAVVTAILALGTLIGKVDATITAVAALVLAALVLFL
jgi:hypothetical protein